MTGQSLTRKKLRLYICKLPVKFIGRSARRVWFECNVQCAIPTVGRIPRIIAVLPRHFVVERGEQKVKIPRYDHNVIGCEKK